MAPFHTSAEGIPSAAVVLQAGLNDCGIACLAMLYHRRGLKFDPGELRARLYPRPDHGVSAAALLKDAADRGISGRGIRVGAEGLEHLRLPGIAFIDGNHWVLVESVSKQIVGYVDPLFGRLRVDRQTFDARFTHVYLEFAPSVT